MEKSARRLPRVLPLFAALFVACVAVLVLVAAARAGAGTTFVAGFDDLPLMDGLHEQADGLVNFDSPQGRIVETTVRGRVTRRAVLKFYDETLPQLGWRRVKAGHYVREDEELSLFFSREKSGAKSGEKSGATTAPSGMLSVRFSLAPAP